MSKQEKLVAQSRFSSIFTGNPCAFSDLILNRVILGTDAFTEDFMFQLTAQELENLKSQFATSSSQVSQIEGVAPNWSRLFAVFGGMDLPRAKESAPSNLTAAAIGGQKSPERSY